MGEASPEEKGDSDPEFWLQDCMAGSSRNRDSSVLMGEMRLVTMLCQL